MKQINGWDKSLFREVSSDKTSKSRAAIRRKLERIRHKLMAGGRLTAEEKAFLRRYAPALYDLAMAMERERAAYEERLKNCRTKEEADRIMMEDFNAAMAGIEKGLNDSKAVIDQNQSTVENVGAQIWSAVTRCARNILFGTMEQNRKDKIFCAKQPALPSAGDQGTGGNSERRKVE